MESKEFTKYVNTSLLNTRPLIITDTVARTDLNGFAVQVIAEAVIASISYNNVGTSNTLVGVTLPAGIVIYLTAITDITLTSGSVIVYQASY